MLLVMIWAMCSVCKTLMQREQRRERRRAKRRRRMSIENDNKPQTEDGAMTSGGWPMTAAQTAGERDMTRTENKRTIGLLPLPDGTVGTPGISLSKADLAFKASKDPKFILDDNKREKFEELMEELMRQEEAESQTDRAKRTSKVISKSDVQVISQSVIPSSAVSQPAIAQSTRIMSKDKILAMIKANASGTSKPTPISLKSTKLHAETDNGLEAGAAPKEMTEESETGQFETIEGNQGSSFDQTNFECDENDLLHPLLFEDQQPEMEADPKSTGNAKRVRSKTDRLCTTKPKVNRVKRSPSHKSFNRKRHR